MFNLNIVKLEHGKTTGPRLGQANVQVNLTQSIATKCVVSATDFQGFVAKNFQTCGDKIIAIFFLQEKIFRPLLLSRQVRSVNCVSKRMPGMFTWNKKKINQKITSVKKY